MNLRIAAKLLLVTIIIIMIGVLWPTKTTTKHMVTTNHILKITGSHSSTTTTTTSLPIKLVAPPTTVTIETTLPVSTTTTTVVPVPTTTTTVPPVYTSVPVQQSYTPAAWSMQAATKVAICESGGWGKGTGGAYIGDLGIRKENWYAYGGTSDVSPEAQAIVAYRIQASPPDQYGCNGGW